VSSDGQSPPAKVVWSSGPGCTGNVIKMAPAQVVRDMTYRFAVGVISKAFQDLHVVGLSGLNKSAIRLHGG
jgi:hypothetical protein